MTRTGQAPRISVAIATYNSGPYLGELLDSVLAQTVLPFEIICADDGSTDGTAELVERYATESPVPVRLIRQARNVGIIENFLSAFRAAEGDAVAYCDHDDVWQPGKLEAAVQALADPSVQLVCQPSIITDAALNPTGEVYFALDDDERHGFPFAAVRLHAWGHQMVFTRAVRDRLLGLYDLAPFRASEWGTCFDYGIMLAASLEGDICRLATPQTLFRRHAAATSDAGLARDAQGGLRARVGERVARLRWEAEMLDRADEILSALPAEDPGLAPIRAANTSYRGLVSARVAMAAEGRLSIRLSRLPAVMRLAGQDSRSVKHMIADLAVAVYGQPG